MTIGAQFTAEELNDIHSAIGDSLDLFGSRTPLDDDDAEYEARLNELRARVATLLEQQTTGANSDG